MSTLPPSSPPSSSTDFGLVRSSGTSVTCGRPAIASRPGSFFHGSAWPTQIRSAPASASARTSAWPTAVLPSVTSTLRNFGSQVISLSIGSSIMCSVSWSGNPTSTAWPAAIEHGPHADPGGRRADVAVQVDDQRRAGIQVHQTQAPRQPLAKEQVVAVVQRGLAEQPAAARLLAPGQVGGQAAMTGFARRVLDGVALRADLQCEPAMRRRRGQAQRDPTTRRRRQRRLPGAQHRVLALGGRISGIDMAALGGLSPRARGSAPRCRGSGHR